MVCEQSSSNLLSLCKAILFKSTILGIHLCKTSQFHNFKTRLGSEICSSDVYMRKGYFLISQQIELFSTLNVKSFPSFGG